VPKLETYCVNEIIMTQGQKGKTVAELAEFLAQPFAGDGSAVIERVASLDAAGPGSVAFVENQESLTVKHF
jgi:UDP-3-O-[3-hydroxymyristoyl] glucosamine N-acyltransferase